MPYSKSPMMFFYRLPIFLSISQILFLFFNFSFAHPQDEFPQLLTQDTHQRHFAIAENRKSRGVVARTFKVYNKMACVHQCTRFPDSCVSVNFKKVKKNGLHACDLLDTEVIASTEEDDQFDFISMQPPIASNCAEFHQSGARTSGVYQLGPSASHPTQVYCDMVTSVGGWTIIQRRQDGSVDFYRDWADYKKGFGNLLGEYWLGLENIHYITSRKDYRLRIDMEDFSGNKRYALYDSFNVADEKDNYRLRIGAYSGTSGDSLSYHNNMQFSTKDHDHDGATTRSCALLYPSGWWHNDCHRCNPNGLYLHGAASHFSKGITWYHWLGHGYSLKKFEMKIQPK